MRSWGVNGQGIRTDAVCFVAQRHRQGHLLVLFYLQGLPCVGVGFISCGLLLVIRGLTGNSNGQGVIDRGHLHGVLHLDGVTERVFNDNRELILSVEIGLWSIGPGG